MAEQDDIARFLENLRGGMQPDDAVEYGVLIAEVFDDDRIAPYLDRITPTALAHITAEIGPDADKIRDELISWVERSATREDKRHHAFWSAGQEIVPTDGAGRFAGADDPGVYRKGQSRGLPKSRFLTKPRLQARVYRPDDPMALRMLAAFHRDVIQFAKDARHAALREGTASQRQRARKKQAKKGAGFRMSRRGTYVSR